jgi:hypothetical protein
MKTSILLFSCLLAGGLSYAQSAKQPIGGNIRTPAPLSQKYKTADLTISYTALVSAVKDDNQKAFIIKVKAGIKNKGELAAPVSKLRGFVQNTGGGAQLNELDNLISIPPIKAGAVHNAEFTFIVPFAIQRGSRFQLVLRADNTYLVTESDENNNSSLGILIGL